MARKISSFRIRRGDWCVRACEDLWRRRFAFLAVVCAVGVSGALIGPVLQRSERIIGLWIAGIALCLAALVLLPWNLRLTVDRREVGGVFLAEHRFFLLAYRRAKVPLSRARLGWIKVWEEVWEEAEEGNLKQGCGCLISLVPIIGGLLGGLLMLAQKKSKVLRPTEVLVLRDVEEGGSQRVLGEFKDASHREKALESLVDLEPDLVDLNMGPDIYPKGRWPDEKGEA